MGFLDELRESGVEFEIEKAADEQPQSFSDKLKDAGVDFEVEQPAEEYRLATTNTQSRAEPALGSARGSVYTQAGMPGATVGGELDIDNRVARSRERLFAMERDTPEFETAAIAHENLLDEREIQSRQDMDNAEAQMAGAAARPFVRAGSKLILNTLQGVAQTATLPYRWTARAVEAVVGPNEFTTEINKGLEKLDRGTNIQGEVQEESQERINKRLEEGELGWAIWDTFSEASLDMSVEMLKIVAIGSAIKGTAPAASTGKYLSQAEAAKQGAGGLGLLIPGLAEGGRKAIALNALTRGAISFVTTPGSEYDKASSAWWTFAAMMTPILAREAKYLAPVADMGLNTLVSISSQAYPNAWKQAEAYAEKSGNPDDKIKFFLAQAVPIMIQDAVASSGTRYKNANAQARNAIKPKLSPEEFAKVDKALFNRADTESDVVHAPRSGVEPTKDTPAVPQEKPLASPEITKLVLENVKSRISQSEPLEAKLGRQNAKMVSDIDEMIAGRKDIPAIQEFVNAQGLGSWKVFAYDPAGKPIPENAVKFPFDVQARGGEGGRLKAYALPVEPKPTAIDKPPRATEREQFAKVLGKQVTEGNFRDLSHLQTFLQNRYDEEFNAVEGPTRANNYTPTAGIQFSTVARPLPARFVDNKNHVVANIKGSILDQKDTLARGIDTGSAYLAHIKNLTPENFDRIIDDMSMPESRGGVKGVGPSTAVSMKAMYHAETPAEALKTINEWRIQHGKSPITPASEMRPFYFEPKSYEMNEQERAELSQMIPWKKFGVTEGMAAEETVLGKAAFEAAVKAQTTPLPQERVARKNALRRLRGIAKSYYAAHTENPSFMQAAWRKTTQYANIGASARYMFSDLADQTGDMSIQKNWTQLQHENSRARYNIGQRFQSIIDTLSTSGIDRFQMWKHKDSLNNVAKVLYTDREMLEKVAGEVRGEGRISKPQSELEQSELGPHGGTIAGPNGSFSVRPDAKATVEADPSSPEAPWRTRTAGGGGRGFATRAEAEEYASHQIWTVRDRDGNSIFSGSKADAIKFADANSGLKEVRSKAAFEASRNPDRVAFDPDAMYRTADRAGALDIYSEEARNVTRGEPFDNGEPFIIEVKGKDISATDTGEGFQRAVFSGETSPSVTRVFVNRELALSEGMDESKFDSELASLKETYPDAKFVEVSLDNAEDLIPANLITTKPTADAKKAQAVLEELAEAESKLTYEGKPFSDESNPWRVLHDAIRNELQGPTAVNVRLLQVDRWMSKWNQHAKELAVLEARSSLEPRDQQRLETIRSELRRVTPLYADKDGNPQPVSRDELLKAAKIWAEQGEEAARVHLAGEGWGTRRTYWMTQRSDEFLPRELETGGVDMKTDEGNDFLKTGAPGPINPRIGMGDPKTGDPLGDLYRHAFRMEVRAASLRRSRELYRSVSEATFVPESVRKAMQKSIYNTLAVPQEISPTTKVMNAANKLFWRSYPLAISRLGWYTLRNRLQPLALMGSQIRATEVAKSVVNFKAKMKDPNSRLRKADMEIFESTVSQKGEMLREAMYYEEGSDVPQYKGEIGRIAAAIDDFGKRVFAWSDDGNRHVGFGIPYDVADRAVGDFLQGRITQGDLEKRLLVSNLPLSEQTELMEKFNNAAGGGRDAYEPFVREFALKRNANINFLYKAQERSGLEQYANSRWYLGIMVWPRGAAEVVYRNGIKATTDGFKTGNPQQAMDGIRTLWLYAIGMYATGVLGNNLLGEKGRDSEQNMYHPLQSMYWDPNSPGAQLIHKTFELMSLLRDSDPHSRGHRRRMESTADWFINKAIYLLPVFPDMANWYEAHNYTWGETNANLLMSLVSDRLRSMKFTNRDWAEWAQHAILGTAEKHKSFMKSLYDTVEPIRLFMEDPIE